MYFEVRRIFLILVSMTIHCYDAFQLTTNPINATIQRIVSLTCTTDEPKIQFRILPNPALCLITGSYTNGSCIFSGSHIEDYIYTCDTENEYTVTIPGNLVTEELHSTEWICQNPFDGSIKPAKTMLYVNIPISSVTLALIPKDSNSVAINNGSSREFKCTTNVGRPSSRIHWYLSDTNLTSNASVQPDNCDTDCKDGKVISSSVLNYTGNIKDEGKYIFCTAMNLNEMDVIRSQNISLIIRYGPQNVVLSTLTKVYIVNETDSIERINCTADCKPQCTIVWTGPNLPNDTRSFLHLQNVHRDQAGDYRCTATNMVGNKTSVAVNITINYGPRNVTISPPKLSYTVNETDNLGPISCTALCKPECKMKWTKQTLPVGIQSKLNLQNISRSDAGEYQCRAENFLGHILFSAVLIVVHYGPQKVVLSPPTTTYTVNETDSIGPISCTADCKPNCTMAWNGPNLPNGLSVLNIVNVDWNQAGEYRCIASNKVSSKASVAVNVTINYGPKSVIISPPKLSYTVNETSNLGPIYCTANCKPGCETIWIGPNLPEGTQSELNLQNVSKSQAGKYICRAENFLGGSTSGLVEIVVQYGPVNTSITPSRNNYTVNETDIVGPIYCTAECIPNCTMVWSGPNLPSDTQYELIVSNINRTETGNYKCTASNIIGRVTFEAVNIFVQYRPNIYNLSGKKTVLENETVDIYCRYNSFPGPSITWKFDNMSIADEGSIQTNVNVSALSFPTIKCLSMGTYVCEANNILGNDLQKFDLEVNCSARINYVEYENPDTVAVRDNEPINLTAYIIAHPSPDIYWRFVRNGSVYNITSGISQNGSRNRYSSNLLIVNVTEENFGYYEIYAYNGIGNIDNMRSYIHSYHVIPARKPDKPENVSCEVKPGSVILNWKPGFNGGDAQVFSIYYKNTKNEVFVKYPNTYNDTRKKEYVSAVISQVMPNTRYVFQILAKNKHNQTGSELVFCNTSKSDLTDQENSNLVAIGAGTGTAVAVIVIISIMFAIFIRKHRRDGTSGKDDILISRENKEDKIKEACSNDELKDNILYVSAGPEILINDGQGSAVTKSNSDLAESHLRIQETSLYAEVNKKNNGKGISSGKERKNGGKGNKSKLKQSTAFAKKDDVYENISTKCDADVNTAWRTNKDGLAYADLVFIDGDKGKKFVIRGLENRTDYADIDFNLKADPLPCDESDNEGENPKEKQPDIHD